MLLRGDGVPAAVKAGVKSHHYSETRHSLLHDAMVDACIDNRGQMDAVTLSEYLSESKRLEAVGSIEYLIELLEAVPASARLEEFAADVIHRSADR